MEALSVCSMFPVYALKTHIPNCFLLFLYSDIQNKLEKQSSIQLRNSKFGLFITTKRWFWWKWYILVISAVKLGYFLLEIWLKIHEIIKLELKSWPVVQSASFYFFWFLIILMGSWYIPLLRCFQTYFQDSSLATIYIWSKMNIYSQYVFHPGSFSLIHFHL